MYLIRPQLFNKMMKLHFNLLPCFYKSIFGIDCPICGFQRSFVLLLNGDITSSFKMYAPLVPSLFLMLFFFIHLFNNKLIKRNFIIYFSSIVLIIISINYIVKLL